MVTFVKGDIFKSPAQVLTNTVNCVGVMGKGVALDQGNVKPGQPYLWEDDSAQVLNFPTKQNWRDNSLLKDIEDGLKHFASSYEQMGIQSIAMPALGCGLGGLKWSEVQPLIVKHLGALPDLDVYVYEPQNVAAIKGDDQGLDSHTKAAKEKISARPQEL